MGMSNKLRFEITEWGILAVVIVVVSVVVLQFNNIPGVRCDTGYTYNASANNCYLTTQSNITTAVGDLTGTIDLFVAGLSEPANWVAIVIISLIGFGLIALFTKDK